MPRALLIAVRFHDGRYHGAGPWPPAPARLFQALVAAAARGATLDEMDIDALKWLERRDAPLIVAPPARVTKGYSNYVPNNDLDAVDGDVRRIGKIKAPKLIKAMLFHPAAKVLYLWQLDDAEGHAVRICAIANRLYQLGRGVDMAFATAEIMDADRAEACLAEYRGAIYRPCTSGSGSALSCPQSGSLQSLVDRYKATGERFTYVPAPAASKGKKQPARVQTFTQPPKPRFRQVVYDSPPVQLLFELRARTRTEDFFAWPLDDIVRLVETVRDGAAETLAAALPERTACIERVFIGRGATEADKASRIRIIPLPSIGHVHAERSIRRLLVEVPPDCPLDPRDIAWAFTAWTPHDRDTGELSGWQLVEIDEHAGERYAKMPGHYGIGGSEAFRRWRTITPAALPERAARRRIDPARIREEAKTGSERALEEASAAAAVRDALRHVGITTPAHAIRVQREPFEAKGARAEAFARTTRFSKYRLWHVDIALAAPVSGPLVIGDGRYLGLGIMAPAKAAATMHAFAINSTVCPDVAPLLARALRRAVMARVRDVLGKRPDEGLPLIFSGHEADGAPATERHAHLFYAVEPGPSPRLLVIAPHRVVRGMVFGREAENNLRILEGALADLRRIVAGTAGVHDLVPLPEPLAGDPLLGPAQSWETRTLYRPGRHASRGKDPAAALVNDVITECWRRGLPEPRVDVLDRTSGPNGGNVAARLRLCFAVAVAGPILLGRDSHQGGGLFATVR